MGGNTSSFSNNSTQNSIFGPANFGTASKSTAGGFASVLTGAPKDQSEVSGTVAKPSISNTIAQQSSILITTKKKTNSGGSNKKKSKNLAKELFSLTDTSVLDKNNNQVSSE